MFLQEVLIVQMNTFLSVGCTRLAGCSEIVWWAQTVVPSLMILS